MTITAPAPRTRTRGASRTPARGRNQLDTPVATPGADRGRARSAAAQRAYARRAERQATALGERLPTPASIVRRAPFVLVVMLLLATGIVVSLWLTTAASADSYRLEQARLEARDLTERSEQLRQEVAKLETAPELARQARELGMVAPVGEPAVLAVQPDGSVVVVGEPEAAVAPAPPQPPAPPAPAQPPADPAAPPAAPAADGAGAAPPADPAAPPADPAAPPADPAAPPGGGG